MVESEKIPSRRESPLYLHVTDKGRADIIGPHHRSGIGTHLSLPPSTWQSMMDIRLLALINKAKAAVSRVPHKTTASQSPAYRKYPFVYQHNVAKGCWPGGLRPIPDHVGTICLPRIQPSVHKCAGARNTARRLSFRTPAVCPNTRQGHSVKPHISRPVCPHVHSNRH